MSAIVTYLTPLGSRPAEGSPRVGERVHLRPGNRGAEIEAWSDSGQRLGRLPPAERNMLASLGLGHPLTARITALLPRPGAPQADRVLLQVEAA